MSSPIKIDAIEVVSGGDKNPVISAGTTDPQLGLDGPEGSLYLRHGANSGKLYVKTGPDNRGWKDVSEKVDSEIDSKSVSISSSNVDNTAGLVINRSPDTASDAVGIDLTIGANVNANGSGIRINDQGNGSGIAITKSNYGSALHIDVSSSGAKAIDISVTMPGVEAPVSIFSNAGGKAELVSIMNMPLSPSDGDGLVVTMGANSTGSGICVSHYTGGTAIEVIAGDIEIGSARLRCSGSKLQISNSGSEYADILTAGMSQSIGVTEISNESKIISDCAASNMFNITLNEDGFLCNPINLVSGGIYFWSVTQGESGGKSLSYDSMFKWRGGRPHALSKEPGAIDLITAIYNGDSLLASFNVSFS
jgi:hypothetical protein